MRICRILPVFCLALVAILVQTTWAINGGTLRVAPRNGWRAFEVISQNDNPAGDGFTWAMPGSFDGMGAWLPDASTLRVQVNHELSAAASVSEVNINLPNLQTAIRNVIGGGTTGGVAFVDSARLAWTNSYGISSTPFSRFCSGQTYRPNAFGADRGFVDNIYITGEEDNAATYKRLLAIDLANRDLYQLSGVTGSAAGGIGGMPFDSWENAALLDTGDITHVALMLSPDGGSQNMKIYIGDKGKDAAGNASTSFLARNGLAYGRYYYLNGTFPATSASPATSGTFSTSTVGALNIAKFEDVDTNPNNGTQVVQGIQETGLFTYDFNLAFSGGNFSTATSSFSLKKIRDQNNDLDGLFGDADNVDWTAATTLNGTTYSNGLIFVNEDSGTSNGETWMMSPTGAGLSLIADTIGIAEGTETSGIVDISTLVGFKPGSILLTNNQGSVSSQAVLINPQAALAGDFNGDGIVDTADYPVWRKGLGATYFQSDYETWRAQFGQSPANAGGAGTALTTAQSIPEPFLSTSLALLLSTLIIATRRRA